MTQMVANLLQKNQTLLTSSAPALAAQLSTVDPCAVEFRTVNTSSDPDLYISGERILEATNYSLDSILKQQLDKTDGVAVPRPFRNKQVSMQKRF